MPDKARRDRKKRPQIKKSKAMQRSTGASAHTPVAAQSRPAEQTGVTAPRTGALRASATPTVGRYPYITTELRRIGILGGIMLGILIVLALFLS
jgi:hypothetical protein